MSGFEGSYMGDAARIGPNAVMECKICWYVYDPARGDDTRQVSPGTPFAAVPDDWSCPDCGAPAEQFLVARDPGTDIDMAVARLVADFTEIWHGKMRDVPMVNPALRVQAVGFRPHAGRPIGVLVAPWFMNLVQLPGAGDDWSALVPGVRETLDFASGEYEFLHNVREQTGGYKACALFSPMGEFRDQAQAVEVAEAVMVALFQEEHRAETDRSADIRAAREADLARSEPHPAAEAPSRRQVISAGLAGAAE